MKKIGNAIIKRITACGNPAGVMVSTYKAESGEFRTILGGAHCAVTVPGTVPNAQYTDTETRHVNSILNVITKARENATTALDMPEAAAVKAYRTATQTKYSKPQFDFGDKMPVVSAQYLEDILTIDKTAVMYYNSPKSAIYIKGDLIEGVLMPIQPKDTENRKRTVLQPYISAAKLAKMVWYLRGNENDTEPITFIEYSAKYNDKYPEEVEPETITEPTPAEPAEVVTDAEPETPAEPPAEENTTTTEEPTETAEETPAAENVPKVWTSEELREILHTSENHVKFGGLHFHAYGENKIYYTAKFVENALYRIPESAKKSRAVDIVFRVDRNTGKSVNITVWEKYNGTITESVYKNKKTNPGSKCTNIKVNTETGQTVNPYKISDEERKKCIDFLRWECFDTDKISRWTSGDVNVIRCEPLTQEDFNRFQIVQHTAGTPSTDAAETPAAPLDYTPKYYPVSEKLARLHKEAISYFDYKEGSQTAEYKAEVDSAYKLAENSNDPEKALFLADVFARKLARWFDDMNRNGASCPSVMIAGPAKFPVRKKERQNARHDTLMKQYNKIMHLKEKIAHPRGYEIERDTISNEFENVLYFAVNINETENRLQLIFEDKPAENIRVILKSNGFRWSGRFKAWQRQLTENAVSAVWRVVDALDKIEETEAAEAVKESKQTA